MRVIPAERHSFDALVEKHLPMVLTMFKLLDESNYYHNFLSEAS